MNKEFHKRKSLEMLDDKSFYQQVESQSTKGIMKKVQIVISLAKEFTRHEINYLLDFECKQSMRGPPDLAKENYRKS